MQGQGRVFMSAGQYAYRQGWLITCSLRAVRIYIHDHGRFGWFGLIEIKAILFNEKISKRPGM